MGEFAKCLKFVKELEVLDISTITIFVMNLESFVGGNMIEKVGAVELANNLHFIPKLKIIKIGNMFLSRQKKIFLGYNNLDMGGTTEIGNKFKFIPSLKQLHIGIYSNINVDGNYIGDKNISQLFSFIKYLEELEILNICNSPYSYLAYNQIGPQGIKAILNLQPNSNLNSLKSLLLSIYIYIYNCLY